MNTLLFFKKNILLFSLFFLFSFSSVFAETLVQTDITQDTLWTKEMSPILLERSKKDREKGSYDIHVINGATLTIEAGVKVVIGDMASLYIVRHCERDYYDKCVKDTENKIQYPRLLALGTEEEPILFTSVDDYKKGKGQPGQWGRIEAMGDENVLRFVSIQYGGWDTNYALRLGKDSLLESSKIQNHMSNALYGENTTILSSVFSENNGTAITCNGKCILEGNTIANNEGIGVLLHAREFADLKENFIAHNNGAAIVVQAHKDMNIEKNFLYNNRGIALDIESEYNLPLKIQNNSFFDNYGGVHLSSTFDSIEISQNNFLKNTDFSIRSENMRETALRAAHNWFGIDSGPQTSEGQFFVSSGIDASDFRAEANDFSLTGSSVATQAYKDYLETRKIDTQFISLNVKKKLLFGAEEKQGSLFLYEVDVENLKTKMLNNLKLSVQMPSGQTLSACSIQENIQHYSFDSVCKKEKNPRVQIANNTFSWILDLPALQQSKLSFVTMLSGKPPLKNPSIQVSHSLFGDNKNISYSIGVKTDLDISKGEELNTSTEVREIPEIVSTPKTRVQRSSLLEKLKKRRKLLENANTSSETLLTPQELAEKFYGQVNLSKNPEWNTYPIEDRKKAYELIMERKNQEQTQKSVGALATGTMTTKVVNNQLRFVLQADDGNEYSLLNSAKWQDLVNFIRSDKKKNRIAVFGDYYTNRSGEKSAIMFTEFQLLP